MKHWRVILARLPLPMLALAASYGVFSFAQLFVPLGVAIIQAAAFELTYIGLAVTQDLSATTRKRATAISVGAVVASIVYNTLSGWFHRQPQLLDNASPIAWLMFAILHGAPLAWVAYLVADLLLHSGEQKQAISSNDPSNITPAAPAGRVAPFAAPPQASPNDSGEAIGEKPYWTMDDPFDNRTDVLVASVLSEARPTDDWLAQLLRNDQAEPSNLQATAPDDQAPRYECPWCQSDLASKQAKGSAARYGCEQPTCPGRSNRKHIQRVK